MFAPMAKFITIRCICVLGAAKNWAIHQMNIKMTFLNEILEVEIDMGGFCRKKKTSCVKTQENFVWAQAIVEDVVTSCQLIPH